MRIGLVVDASCDLPRSFLQQHAVHVLPNVLTFGSKHYVDDRSPEETMGLFRRLIADKSVPADARACEVDEIRALFLDELVCEYDRVLVLTACAGRSEAFSRATEASYAILQSYRERREAAGRSGTFALRILDSRTLGAGQGVLACRAVSVCAGADMPFEKLRSALSDEASRVRTLFVPNDLFYLRQRGLGGPADAIGAVGYAVGRMARLKPVLELSAAGMRVVARGRGFGSAASAALDVAREAVREGLGAPVMVLSFGGDPRVIRDLPAYQDLEAQAANRRVELHLAVMSATLGVRLGPGAMSVAWVER